MKIIVGKTSGFCNGVSYTVKKATEIIEKYKENVYCLGEIVHNSSVIDSLKQKGIIFVDDINEIPNKSIVIFRAHGEPKETYEIARKKELKVFDLTCGKIRVIRNKIAEEIKNSFIVILGKKNHPETIGTYSYCRESGFVVENEDDIDFLIDTIKNQEKSKIYINSQTTFGIKEFEKLTSIIKEKLNDYEVKIDNTICMATHDRQTETHELSKQVSKMIIVGGKNSSNTKELAKVAEKNCQNVYLVSDASELDVELFNEKDVIGIMGGASTPEEDVEKIKEKLETI